MRTVVVAVVCSALVLGATERPCGAQAAEPPADTAAVTPERAAAARAFADGQRAYEARDFVHAGELFEEAYKHVQHHGSLWNAARSWQQAGQRARAANLVTRFLREAPAGAAQRAEATDLVHEMAPYLGRLEVHLSEGLDLVRVDGNEVVGGEVYVSPGDHEVAATGRGQARKVVTAAAGETVSVILDVPPAQQPPAPLALAPSPPLPLPPRKTALGPPVLIVGSALTVTALGFTVASGLDTLSKRDAFLEHRNQANYDRGASAQGRTNVLISVTVVLALATVVTWALLGEGRAPASAAAF